MPTPAEVLTTINRTDSAAPRVTCYDDLPGPTAGERVELSGRVEAGGRARGPVAITVNLAAPRAGEGAGEGYMARTGQQVARAVRQALTRVDG